MPESLSARPCLTRILPSLQLQTRLALPPEKLCNTETMGWIKDSMFTSFRASFFQRLCIRLDKCLTQIMLPTAHTSEQLSSSSSHWSLMPAQVPWDTRVHTVTESSQLLTTKFKASLHATPHCLRSQKCPALYRKKQCTTQAF